MGKINCLKKYLRIILNVKLNREIRQYFHKSSWLIIAYIVQLKQSKRRKESKKRPHRKPRKVRTQIHIYMSINKKMTTYNAQWNQNEKKKKI